MRYRRQGAAVLAVDVNHRDHVREFSPSVRVMTSGSARAGRTLHMKPLVGFFDRYRGRERPECFAHFYHRVYSVPHIRQARVSEYAAMAERSRAKLHPATVPGDDAAISY